MKPKPNIGDIWRWNSDSLSIIPSTHVLIMTVPSRDNLGWDFQALELDGDQSGVVQEWSMRDEAANDWEFIA